MKLRPRTRSLTQVRRKMMVSTRGQLPKPSETQQQSLPREAPKAAGKRKAVMKMLTLRSRRRTPLSWCSFCTGMWTTFRTWRTTRSANSPSSSSTRSLFWRRTSRRTGSIRKCSLKSRNFSTGALMIVLRRIENWQLWLSRNSSQGLMTCHWASRIWSQSWWIGWMQRTLKVSTLSPKRLSLSRTRNLLWWLIHPKILRRSDW